MVTHQISESQSTVPGGNYVQLNSFLAKRKVQACFSRTYWMPISTWSPSPTTGERPRNMPPISAPRDSANCSAYVCSVDQPHSWSSKPAFLKHL